MFAHRPNNGLTPLNDLKDVQLSPLLDAGSSQRKPLEVINGHQLMSIFPTQAPETIPEMRPGPTSGYFERQERAYFARGNELHSVQLFIERKGADGDLDASSRKNFQDKASKFTWPPPPSSPTVPKSRSSTPRNDSSTPLFYPHPGARGPSTRPPPPPPSSVPGTEAEYSSPSSTSAVVPVTPSATTTTTTTTRRVHTASPPSSTGTTPVLTGTNVHNHRRHRPSSSSEDHHADEDDAWRRPMPHHERRRAGKHTKRIVVR